MASAYAALVSVMQIIHQIQHHPRPPISLHQQQIHSLTQTVSFLQQFLEAGYCNQAAYTSGADPLGMRIAEAAHAVEDVIESHIVDHILGDAGEISSVDLYGSVQKLMDDMESVKKEVMDVKEKTQSHQFQLPAAYSSTSADSGPEQFRTMVGFDDIMNQVLDKLTRQGSRRQIISLTGMGGIGKSTLAKNVYHHPLVVEYFHFRAMVTVSQQYNIRKILLKMLEGCDGNMNQVDENELRDILHKTLTGRRYLIIIDDIWDMEVWVLLRRYMPDNNIGSRIVITTRLSNLARKIDVSHVMEMPTIDEDNGWKLFCKHVFKEEDCPLELQGIGKQIVEGCNGIPLSISVVGGLLAKSKRTNQYWEEIAKNLNSTVNLDNDKHCLQILYMSYYNLPIHLKPYFLYMGIILSLDEGFFPLDMLVPLLVVEGFVKPVSGKSLEDVAKECIAELVERNLLIIDETEKHEDWIYKDCRIHDLLRELCLRESDKQKFVHVVKEGSVKTFPHNMASIRRICVAKNTPDAEVLPFLESASLLRSLWCFGEGSLSLSSIRSRLLRFALTNGTDGPESFIQKVNLRVIYIDDLDQYRSLSSLSRFWNLQILNFYDESPDVLVAPHDIWVMHLLRNIFVRTPLFLPDPPTGETDNSIILENLYRLSIVNNFKCTEEVVKRIPHVKHLRIHYTEVEGSYDVDYCLNNLFRLQRLKVLKILVQMPSHIIENQIISITYPNSLAALSLSGTGIHWDDVTVKIGSLPLLRILYLDTCKGAKWETIEGHFCRLRDLNIADCPDLEYWVTESTHFPYLELLYLESLNNLQEIPSSIGNIPTLERIKLRDCCDSLYKSAQTIKEEQEENGNEDIQVEILED